MAYDRYRAAGLGHRLGHGRGACKHLIGAREKGPGMRWSEAAPKPSPPCASSSSMTQWATYDLAA